MSLRTPVLFFLLLFSATTSMFATNYYVSPNGNDFFFGTDPGFPWATVSRVNSANLKAGDQVYFARGGTWREMLTPQTSGVYYGAYGSGPRPLITASNKLSNSLIPSNGAFWTPSSNGNVWSISVGGFAPLQVWFNGVLGTAASSSAAVLGPNQWYYDGQCLYVYSSVYPALLNAPVIEATQRYFALAINNVSNITMEHLAFSNGYYSVIAYNGNNGQHTFNDVVVSGGAVEGISLWSGGAMINGSEIVNNTLGLGVHGGTGVNLSDSIISGSFTQAINIAGSTGPSYILGSTITGNATHTPNTHVVVNASSYALSAQNSVLLPNPFEPKVYNYTGLTDAGNNVYQSAFFQKRSAPLIVVPFIDDYINLGVAQAVTAVAKSYGCNLSYALNTKLLSSTAWQQVAALQAGGDEIVAHTRSHSDLANNNVFSIQYTGTASSAVMMINQTTNRLLTYLNGSTVPDLNLDLSNTYNGVIDVLSLIPAGKPYTVSIQPNQNYFTPINLAATAGNVDIKSHAYVATANANYLTWEVEGAQADIAANLPGYHAKTFATPFTSSNVTVENHIRDAGFIANRNGLLNANSSPDGNWLLSNLDVYNMAAEWLPFAFDATKSLSSTDALVEGLGAAGGVMAVYSHGYDEFSLQNWTSLFANLKAAGATCMTMSQANAYIEAQGQLIPDGTKKNWVESVPLTPSFVTTALSPATGAHGLQ